MSRDEYDIPEVFRRAMEEGGWLEKDDNGGDGQRPSLPRGAEQPFWRNRSLWVIALLVILFLSLNWIVTTYTEWLWFTQLNYQKVWFKQWGIQVLSFILSFVIAITILLANWHAARGGAIRSLSSGRPQILQLSGMKWLINGAALFLTFGFAGTGASQWEEYLLYFYRVSYGVADPIFKQDISFYLFELPIYTFLQGWVLSLLFVALLGIIAIYALNNISDIQRGTWQPQNSAALRRHVALLGAFILGLWALGYWFDTYQLLYSSRGVVVGASYTDMNASLWALWAQLVLMALTAVAVLYNIFRLSLRPVLALGGLWLAATLLLGGVYPGLLQRYAVVPNEIVRESPYIAYNIEFTRLAFGLDKIETRPFAEITDLSQKDLDDNAAVLKNIRLWDYRPLRDTYEQLQALRTYYQFGEVDIDRYMIDGELRQVMLGARELDKTKLPATSWVNLNLEYTHGYGIVMNPVNRITAEGQPEFFIQDLPPQSSISLEVERPEIYYSELTKDAVFVSSGRKEFSYPSGSENVYSSYAGKGGVPLDNYLKRLAFAYRLGDINVMLSDEIDSGTKIQFHRQIRERVRQITPFLALDDDPYIVLWNGRLVWMLDAYTLSDKFPYATPSAGNRFNYIRNAAKITVDAYDGTVTYYIADPDDPLIRAYDRAFPGLFRPLSDMPEGLQAHIRYPEDLFLIQTQQYLTYHMLDVRVFYNKEDLWEIPQELFEGGQQPIEPYYVVMSLPGSKEIEYLLIQPYTPSGKGNMIAWVAARNDAAYYGELIVYELPKQELVFGPMQVESRIDQETSISQQFSLWDQRGSSIIRGNLLVIPLNDSFLYVEPIYLRASTSALPELKRVIVASDTRIAMNTTLEGALADLLVGEPVVDVGEGDVGEGETPVLSEAETAVSPPETEPTETTDVDATIEELITSANAHFEAAETAQRDGDWATYGQELEALQRDLEQLMELTGN